MLGVSSSRGTVHVFNLIEEDKLTNREEDVVVGSTHDNANDNTTKSSSKQRWYDPLLSSIKKAKNNENGTTGNNSAKMKIIRSIAKIKCERKPAVVPNTIAMLPMVAWKDNEVGGGKEEEEGGCHVAICFDNGKLLVYAVRKSSSSMIKARPRPILADDIMFDSEDAISK